jgi:diguanylate cyclase (GGDEF)-like protein
MRRAFSEALRRELARAKRVGTPLAVLHIGIDEVKAVNDARGHQRGDEVLRLMSKSPRVASREMGIVARLAGDEFCIVLPGVDEEGATAYCNWFINRLAACCKDVAVSVGICCGARRARRARGDSQRGRFQDAQ